MTPETNISHQIRDCMNRAGEPLTEDQFMLLAGYLAQHLNQALQQNAAEIINSCCQTCYLAARKAGWWSDPKTGHARDRNDGEMIALMHSELSEALEAIRKKTQDNHLPHRSGVEVELADLLIRVFDYAGARGLKLGDAMVEKLEYNRRRADHKPENRLKEGGKAF